MTYKEAKEILTKENQQHVLEGFERLTGEQQEMLLSQIAAIDWKEIRTEGDPEATQKGVIEPLGAMELSEISARKEEYRKVGLQELQAGHVAALLLAGGMGTRLGSDRPKGELTVGLKNDLCIFECLIRNLQDVTREAGCSIPLYIMTSEKNDADTRAFFAEKHYFGYPKEDVKFFVQDMAPAVDYNGKLLLEAPGRLATSPNGNGGWFVSLAKAGLLEDVHQRGIRWMNIFAVDNVLQRICDPVFIGATVLSGCKSGSKVIPKVSPTEKLGVLCKEDGRPSIVEYYEMTDAMIHDVDEKGNLLYRFGVILNYLFRVDQLEAIMERHLPLHVVEKKIPYMTWNDGQPEYVKPEEPNGYKFEQLVLDMIRMMDDTLPFEVEREKEFAPIKNLHGVDSLDTARELLLKNGVEL